MILNPVKSHFRCFGKYISDPEILNHLNSENLKEVEILGVTTDRNFTMSHIVNICRKVG